MPGWFPLFNTSLIVASGVALVAGRIFIARKNVPAHKWSMVTATSFAFAFLIVYVVRWVLYGSTPFTGSGWVRGVYFGVLIGHSILAVIIAPMVWVTLKRALAGNYVAHRRIARITFPTWLVVAASGWVIYWMLYHL